MLEWLFGKKKSAGKSIDEVSEMLSEYAPIVHALLEYARGKGMISCQGFPNIPELMMPAITVCRSIVKQTDVEAPDVGVERGSLVMGCMAAENCLIAGIGLVSLWNDDWSTLKRKGFFESLTENGGVNGMEDYVFGDLLTEEDADAIRPHMETLMQIAMCPCLEGRVPPEQSYISMYLAGIVIRMDQLGMR